MVDPSLIAAMETQPMVDPRLTASFIWNPFDLMDQVFEGKMLEGEPIYMRIWSYKFLQHATAYCDVSVWAECFYLEFDIGIEFDDEAPLTLISELAKSFTSQEDKHEDDMLYFPRQNKIRVHNKAFFWMSMKDINNYNVLREPDWDRLVEMSNDMEYLVSNHMPVCLFCEDCTEWYRPICDRCLVSCNQAANKIQCHWRRSITDPEYKLCRQRLLREFDELVV